MSQKRRLEKLVAIIAKLYTHLVLLTSSFSLIVSRDAEEFLASGKPCIFGLWHGRVFLIPTISRFGKIAAVVSEHKDGVYLQEYVKLFGHGIITGSSRKGALKALLAMKKRLEEGGRIIVTPDGPRGPRHSMNSKLVWMARTLKVPVLPVCAIASRAKFLSTWDRFMIPLPFSKIVCSIDEPIWCDMNSKDNKIRDIMIKQEKRIDSAI